MTFLGATTLTGRLVRLEPLAEGHVDGLADAVRDGVGDLLADARHAAEVGRVAGELRVERAPDAREGGVEPLPQRGEEHGNADRRADRFRRPRLRVRVPRQRLPRDPAELREPRFVGVCGVLLARRLRPWLHDTPLA